MDPKTLKVKEVERRILATLAEHPQGPERTEQLDLLAKELQAAKAEAPAEMTDEERIEAAAQAKAKQLIDQEKIDARANEIAQEIVNGEQ